MLLAIRSSREFHVSQFPVSHYYLSPFLWHNHLWPECRARMYLKGTCAEGLWEKCLYYAFKNDITSSSTKLIQLVPLSKIHIVIFQFQMN